jgi:polyhydroxyalkanoate synthesis regulator phasin
MTKQITNRIIDYINEKLEQIEYYKRPQNMVDVLGFIKEEVLAIHDGIVAKESEMSVKNAEISMLRDRVSDLRRSDPAFPEHPFRPEPRTRNRKL